MATYVALSPLPLQFQDEINSKNMNGGTIEFYLAGTTTPTNLYSDNAGTSIGTSITLNSAGMPESGGNVITLFHQTGVALKLVLKNAAGITLSTSDNITSAPTFYETTTAEDTAGITPTNFDHAPHPYDVRRVGIVPNNTDARTANTTALQELVDPTKTGPVGKFIFPNTRGDDTYYFDDMIEVRSGCHFDLNECTLDFAKTYVVADDKYGFLNFIRDVTIENGSINVDYDGSAGINAGPVMRIGSRFYYPFGSFTNGVEDEDLTIPMGNIVLRNLRLTSNNPGSRAIIALGGIRGWLCENVYIDGQDSLAGGIFYEFGFYHYETTVANRESSHASGLVFRNIFVKDLGTTAANADGMHLTGCYSAVVENLEVDTAQSAFVFRPGEALFYNVGAPYETGIKRGIKLTNIVGRNLTSNGIQLTGAEAATGYLSSEGLSESEQTDLMRFSVDGFAVDGAINVSGPCSIRNGSIIGAGTSGGLIISDDCIRFDICNVEILDGAGSGVRASFANSLWATPRNKIGSIRNSKIAGNTGAGITINTSESVLVENCQLGYNALYDSNDEITQTSGVAVSTGGNGVVCRGNFVTPKSASVAYNLIGNGDRDCNIERARGTKTRSGAWKIDGIAHDSSAHIADATAAINTTNKYVGKQVWDTSNDRILLAVGTGATDGWVRSDGGATVTPA